MLVYSNEIVGKVTIKQNGVCFDIEMRQSNCLAVFVFYLMDENGIRHKKLYNVFADEQHIKNMKKEGYRPFFDEVVKIRLNMKYKENYKVLKYLVEYYNVECYFE